MDFMPRGAVNNVSELSNQGAERISRVSVSQYHCGTKNKQLGCRKATELNSKSRKRKWNKQTGTAG